ncbi:penicillin acylase family protein [Hoeflea sp. CAU 1731]
MMRVLKALIQFIFFAVPLLLIAAGAGFLWMARSLPPTDGNMTVAGLSGSVTISRDDRGVPHIAGSSFDDVLAGLGFAHAQDRLWQMEIFRRASQGRLSELFGEPTIDADMWLRSLGLADTTAETYKLLPDSGKTALDAYVSGINAWIEREGREFASKWPPEFVILRHEPEPWRPIDVLMTFKLLSITLGENASFEIMRLAFSRLGMNSAEIEDLLPSSEDDNPPELPDMAALLGLATGPLADEEPAGDHSMLRTPPGVLTERASNNWVISGERTTTGKPLLANDPHLGLSAPSVWYLVHLRVENGDDADNLVGVTQPGIPSVLMGRNNHVAWGLTNTYTDVQDIFIEKINPDDPEQYMTPDGWRAFGTKEETIRVKNAEDKTFTRRWTRHGPVLPGKYQDLGKYLPKNTVAALQWVALDPDDMTIMSGLGALTVRTVSEFQDGLEFYVSPMQSMVLADTQGNIGFIAPGRVPIRDPQNKVMGRAPVPGWDATYDWTGAIPFNGLPRQINPRVGAIATANAKMVGPYYPYFLTFDWRENWRQKRIDALIVDNEAPQTFQMSRKAQADVHSLGFATMVPQMTTLVDGRDDVDSDAIARLKAWDFEMVKDSAEPLIFVAWFRQAMIDIYADDLGPVFASWIRPRVNAVERLLSGNTARDWCDNRNTPNKESCAEIMTASLNTALKNLEKEYGADRTQWNWGKAHQTTGSHTPFSNVPVLKDLFDVKVASPGGPYTIDRGMPEFGSDKPYENALGTSMRAVYDLADLDQSTFMTSTGQSGNPFSKHYRDFAEPWSNAQAFTISTDPAAYEAKVEGLWELSPPANN